LNTPIEIVLLTLAVLGMMAGWGFYSSSLVIKSPRSPQETNPGSFGLTYENFSFVTEDGVRLNGWFVPCPGSAKTVISCHGWSAERSTIISSTLFLQNKGYNLLYFDFRNHGDSGGHLSSIIPWECRDLLAAIRALTEQKKEAARWIGVWGLSMGGAVALTTAADHPEIRAVVAESSFTSINETIIRSAKIFYGIPCFPLMPITLFFVRWRLGLDPEPFSPIHHIGRIAPRPVLLIQGEMDRRAPTKDGRRLFEAAKTPRELWTVSGADHGEAHSKDPVAYEKKVSEFFDKVSLPQ
jgi:dipeptidyl aminopeptidase/acylaminoacyl peptidase